MCFIHRMKYRLAIKRNEVLICATTCMNLGNNKLIARSQSQGQHIVQFHFNEMFRIGKSNRDRKYIRDYLGLQERKKRLGNND